MTSGGFWSMGGYARFVWPCYGFAGAVLVWNLASARALLAGMCGQPAAFTPRPACVRSARFS